MSREHVALAKSLHFFNGKSPNVIDNGSFLTYGSNGKIGFSEFYNHENAIILGRVGAYCGSVEICHSKFWASDNTIIVKPIGDQDLQYWYYRLKSFPLRSYAGGAAQPLITQTCLKPIKIEIYKDVSIQKKIASILSAYDDLIKNNQRRIQLLEKSARLLYKEWFVHLRFPGHEHSKIIDGVPEGWERKTLGECVVLNYGKALKKDNRIDGKYPVYGSSGIVGSHNKAIVKPLAIIIGRKGNVGSIYWSVCACWPIDTVYFIHPEESDLYLYYVLKNMTFINTDVAVPGLNRNFAYSRSVIIPEKKIKAEFNDEASLIRAQVEKLGQYNQKLTQARDLLLPRLMNGEIEV